MGRSSCWDPGAGHIDRILCFEIGSFGSVSAMLKNVLKWDVDNPSRMHHQMGAKLGGEGSGKTET